MKKTIVFIALILILVITLSACGKKNTGAEQKNIINDTKKITEQNSKIKKDNTSENKAGIEEKVFAQNSYFSPFTGRPISEKKLHKVVMTSIENSTMARPQSGLDKASIVYEVLVEGGITRFLALYWDKIPDRIGPIRSLRPYMINIALDYNALLLHAGASPAGFALLSESKISHLDQIYHGNYYWRDNNRKIPHNLFTGNFKIDSYLNKLTGQEYDPRFDFEQVSVVDAKDTLADKISIDYWGKYKVLYKYDQKNNNYQRFLYNYDIPHKTAQGDQLTADNILVQYVPTYVKDDEGRLTMDLNGQGEALLFKEGIVVKGKWKNDGNSWTEFYNNNGEKMKLKPGNTWIQVVPLSTVVKYEGSDENGETN